MTHIILHVGFEVGLSRKLYQVSGVTFFFSVGVVQHLLQVTIQVRNFTVKDVVATISSDNGNLGTVSSGCFIRRIYARHELHEAG